DSVEIVHARGVLHRDLKPENAFLTSGSPERVRLLDFGLTRALTVADARLTRAGRVIGTTEYMSPEQLRHGAAVDERADIYSLGVVLFELLTLRLPFVGDRAAIEQG